jgi:integrase/recombinase XerD
VEKVILLRTPLSTQLTPTQQRIWKVLQQNNNQDLSIRNICKLAGYRGVTPWYDAMQDEAFRSMIEALGIAIDRQHTPMTQRVVLAMEDAEAEWQKEVIDIRRLMADYPKHWPAGNFRLDFSCVSNFHLKQFIKRYFRARVGFWESITFNHTLIDMKPFLIALSSRYPELESFAPLTREMVEPLLTLPRWIDSQGRIQVISPQRKGTMVSKLNTMFSYMQQHGWEGAPQRTLIYDEDCPKRPKRRPRPLPQNVVEQLQSHMHLLPPYAHNLVEILCVAGLRTEDALHLPEDCLEYDAAGDPRLRWYNHKMKRDGRPLPITTSVAEAIQRQRDVVKEVPDIFGKQYLFRTEYGLYQFSRFSKHLNQLAVRVPILGEDGRVYHFKPHQMRHTVGTTMINHGMGIADVMAYLDHQSPEMTLHYAEIDDEVLKQKFKALVLSGRAVGGAALKALRKQLERGDESELDWVVSNLRKLSLPWGQCLHHAKANKCPYGQNACFTKDNGPCHKLVTTPEHAPVIVATMEDLKKSKQIADEHGWEMYANDLVDQIRGMEQVLTELQLPHDERPKNRGGSK